MCDSKIRMYSPNPQSDGIWMGLWEAIMFRGGLEGGVPVVGLVPLREEEETPEFILSSV